MSDSELRALQKALTPRTSPYWPKKNAKGDPYSLTEKQTAFLLLNDILEVFYGGAAGGGKSEALLLAALQYVDHPEYAAIIFRRKLQDLKKPGALIHRSMKWLKATDAHWNGETRTWTFPSGAQLTFGYMDTDGDEENYQGGEYQFVGFDEGTHFLAEQYTYMFSRLRRLEGVNIPLRVRIASNPGSRGHSWVKARFKLGGILGSRLNPAHDNKAFVPADLTDNPYLDTEQYAKMFENLDPLRRAQLERGDWDAAAKGGKFNVEDFQIVSFEQVPRRMATMLRHWDLGSTEPTESTSSVVDWTCGVKMGYAPTISRPDSWGNTHIIHEDFYVLNMVHFQGDPGEVERRLRVTAERDHASVPQWIEQERGATGKLYINNLRSHVFPPHFEVRSHWLTASKEERINLFAGRSRTKRVYLVTDSDLPEEEQWIEKFLEEASLYPEGLNDDMLDSSAGAVICSRKQHLMEHRPQARNH